MGSSTVYSYLWYEFELICLVSNLTIHVEFSFFFPLQQIDQPVACAETVSISSLNAFGLLFCSPLYHNSYHTEFTWKERWYTVLSWFLLCGWVEWLYIFIPSVWIFPVDSRDLLVPKSEQYVWPSERLMCHFWLCGLPLWLGISQNKEAAVAALGSLS